MYTSACYLIHCQTNLHAGSGDTTYGIIDRMVQRDPVTNLPCIYASSLKGALREYFEEGPERSLLSQHAVKIFGKKVGSETDAVDNSKGNTIFHEAQLISLPMRSNMRPYFIGTSKTALINFLDKAALFSLDFKELAQYVKNLPEVEEGNPKVLRPPLPDLMVEDFEDVGNIDLPSPVLSSWLGKDILLMHDKDFTDASSDYNLPVIARNNLENGESKNLWYEQIIPHQTRFVFFTVSLETDDFSPLVHGKTIQVGANSSLGYGYCKISKF